MTAMRTGVVTLLMRSANPIQRRYGVASSRGDATPTTMSMVPRVPGIRLTTSGRPRQASRAASATKTPPTRRPKLRRSLVVADRLEACVMSVRLLNRSGSVELEFLLPRLRVLAPHVLRGLAQQIWSEDEIVDVSPHEATEGVFRRAHDRLAAHIE